LSRIAIMQGRLAIPEAGRFQSFPRQQWHEEFARASQADLDAIEWIYDEFGEDVNPIGSNAGLEELHRLSKQHDVAVVSVCADYFMDRPIVKAGSRELIEIVDRLEWLVRRCRTAGIERMVIPFVDQSQIRTEEDAALAIEVLMSALPSAKANSVELHLETSLAPAPFAAFLERLPSPWIKVNYDSGNSSSLGSDPKEEFAAYGSRIGSVHVKDRIRGGGTVPLGTGDADLPTVFRELARVGYTGDYVLQVARGQNGDEVNWARHNREQVLALLSQASEQAARRQA